MAPVPTSTRRRRPATSVKLSSSMATDKLAAQLASLTIDTRLSTMRAVNTASQSLSNVLQSGWKHSKDVSSIKKSSSSSSTAHAAASAAKKGLGELRTMCPGDVDVERAASSVVGKLLALEMFDAALSALSEMQAPLCALYTSPPSAKIKSKTHPLCNILSLPLPAPDMLLSEVLQALISTYFLHATTIAFSACLSSSPPDALSLCTALQNTPTLLQWLSHLPALPAKHKDSVLTRVYSVLTKSSSSSTSTNTSAIVSPHTILSLRTYALHCLLYTSPGSLDPNTFWDQATRFGVSFVKASTTHVQGKENGKEEGVVGAVLTTFEELARLASGREDGKGWMCGRGFVGFCEYWMGFAKRAGDLSILDKIAELMRGASPASSPASSTSSKPQIGQHQSQHAKQEPERSDDGDENAVLPSKVNPQSEKEKKKAQDALLLEGARICAVFAQATTVIEQFQLRAEDSPSTESKQSRAKSRQKDNDVNNKDLMTKRVEEATSLLPRCCALLSTSLSGTENEIKKIPNGAEEGNSGEGEKGPAQAQAKVGRALERLRRVAVKVVDAIATPREKVVSGLERKGNADVACVKELLNSIVGIYEGSSERIGGDNVVSITPVLDTLFVLARTSLVTTNQETYGSAYEYLARATALLGLGDENTEAQANGKNNKMPSAALPELADYVRCISGAFHNLAGTLYQDGKYAVAVRFLKEGCALGGRALRMRTCQGEAESKDQGKGEEGWELLKEQLFRRWELLGICFAKMGDRRLAYDAFIESVKSYPYVEVGFAQLVRTSALSSVFAGSSNLKSSSNSSSLKQLAAIIDRATYIGTCELLLQPSEVSLRCPLEGCGFGADVVGAVLERQAESLDGSLWKDIGVRTVVRTVLADALSVYVRSEDIGINMGAGMPLRRARVLIQSLRFTYRVGDAAEGFTRHSDDIGEEIEELLGRSVLDQDSGLAQFCSQYRVSMHIWLALHAHRREDARQATLVAHHCEEACKILKSFYIGSATAEPSAKYKKSPPTKKSPKSGVVAKSKVKTAAKATIARRGVAARQTRNAQPVTPKPRKASGAVPVDDAQVVTPPRQAVEVRKAVITFENFDELVSLLQMISHLVGLLGLVLVKIKLLDVTRRLCERHAGTSHDGYIAASADLAHEYVKLGKTGKASAIFGQTLIAVRSGGPSDEVRTIFLLRYSESLATVGNVLRSSTTYCEALGLAAALPGEDKKASTSQKVRARVGSLERAALAAHAYSVIQYAREDLTSSLDGMLQSLRLWNRAVDTLARLVPPPVSSKPSSDSESNPFEMSSLKDALPAGVSEDHPQQPEISPPRKTYNRRPSMDGLEWRISNGLLTTLFTLSRTYFTRGSPRESEYFAQQAQDLAESLNAPVMVSRALARKGEILLHQGQLEDGYANLLQAAELLEDILGTDAADLGRLRGYYNQLKAMPQDAQGYYEDARRILEELEKLFDELDSVTFGPRKSTGLSPKPPSVKDVIVPELLAAVLRQHIWLLRDDTGNDCGLLLERFMALPPSGETKAEENALVARLTLHNAYGRFRADMFLSSLVESTIALPMGMSSDKIFSLSPSAQDILATLVGAERLFWADLTAIARRGKVSRMRDAAVSLAMIRALQSSLGKAGKAGPVLAASLLDLSTAITLRREMLEAIQQKFPHFQAFDDLQWPLITLNGSPLPRPTTRVRALLEMMDSDDEDSSDLNDISLKQYWDTVRENYNTRVYNVENLSTSQVDLLPKNWTVISINITEDRNTMFVTRQRAHNEPLIFCLPLKGRRETEDDEHLTFDDALSELKQIITLSNQGTRQAVHVRNDDPQARASWWAERIALDKRMQELLENIEFCWLGAFKTILSQPMKTPPDTITDLRTRIDKVFKRSLHSQERKQKVKIRLDDNLLRCFSTLSPKCRDEELEDLIYFVLDLYQFHGIPVAISEVDVDQVVIDLRTALEEHAVKAKGKVIPEEDNHMFLVLDKNVQGIPWESIPILRGRSVSRIPSIDFLMDRLEFAKWQKDTGHRSREDRRSDAPIDRATVDPKSTYYVLNPSGDLKGTEGRFSSWLTEMNKLGWEGSIGRPPSEQQFLDALTRKDLVIYFGHGGGEQYVRSHKIRHLPRCAATMLWGCSSGALREMGDFDRVGTPYNYMLAGCPTLVANIWDVTDRDIDKFSQAVFDKLRLTTTGMKHPRVSDEVSLVAAVAQSRNSCKLKYLTGAAPVVYGIPFYL